MGGERRRLLLNPEFEGTPLRKDEVLAARTGYELARRRGARRDGDRRKAGLRQVGAGWCLPAFPDPAVWAIATRRRRRLTRPRWPRRCGGQDPAEAYVSSPESAHRWIQLIEPACTSWHDLRARVPELVHQHRLAYRAGSGPAGRCADRTRNVPGSLRHRLVRLCMYCGICVEECPYDALEWVGDLTQPGIARRFRWLRSWCRRRLGGA